MTRNQPKATNALPRCSFYAILLLFCATLLPREAVAIDLNGSWSTDVDVCKDMFVKKGNQTSLSRDADLYGSGFVVSGNIIRGKIATCKITSSKEDGGTVHLQTTCSTDISVSNNQFDLKISDDNRVVRAIPGIPELDTPYYRCPNIQ